MTIYRSLSESAGELWV